MHSARAHARSNQPAEPRRFPERRRRSDDRDDPASVGRAIRALTEAALTQDLTRNEHRACLYLLSHLTGWGRIYDTVSFKELAAALGRGEKTVQRTVGSLVERGLIEYQSAVGKGEHGWIRLLTTNPSTDASTPPRHQHASMPQASESPHNTLREPGQAGPEPCPPTAPTTTPGNDSPGGQPPTPWCPARDTASPWVDTHSPTDAHPPVNPLATANPRSPLQPTTANEAEKKESEPDRITGEPASSNPEVDYLSQLIGPLGNHMGESMKFDKFITDKLTEVATTLRARGYTPQEAFGHAAARGDVRQADRPINLLAYRLRRVLDDPARRSRHETAAAAAETARQHAEREAEHQARENAPHDEERRLAAAKFAAWRLDHPEFATVEALPINEQLALIGPYAALFLHPENGFPHDTFFAEQALTNHQGRQRAGATTRHTPFQR